MDSEIIAQLTLNNMIQSSKVFQKTTEDFVYTFSFVTNLHKKEDLKNEAQAIPAPEIFNLNDLMEYIFWKNDIKILS